MTSSAMYSVLMVDDNAAMREALARSLTRRGCRVTTAAGDVEALQVLKERSFDAVITDLNMPERGGLWLWRQALVLRPELRGRFVLIASEPLPEPGGLSGDVGQWLTGVAAVLAGALGRASLGLRATFHAGAAFLHHHRDHAAAVARCAALRRQAAIGVRQLHGPQCGTGLWLQPVIHSGGWRIFNRQTPLTRVGTRG